MSKTGTAPGKLKSLMILCVIGTVVSIGFTYFVYTISKNTAQAVGKDTVPSIIAAQNIKATLADAHSNAMDAMVTKEKLGGKFWNLYRRDMDSLHSQLVEASRNITYGDAESIPLTAISSNISAYEYTVGGAVANGAEISVDQFMEANRLMQQKILPASSALDRVNLSQLDSTYSSYEKIINILIVIMVLTGIAFLAVLAFTQLYMFKNTHRIFNAGLLLATILFLINIIYSANALNSVKRNLYTAKNDAFTSINAMWNARAVAYNAKSIESLYLLHEGTGIVQTADTINFNLNASRIYNDPNAASGDEKSVGYLNIGVENEAYQTETPALDTAIQQWSKYVELDKQVHSLEYDSRHQEAIALSVGDTQGKSDYEFKKFDAAIGDVINASQQKFDSSIDSAFKTLSIFPYVLLAFLVLIAGACILGMKARMDEYRV